MSDDSNVCFNCGESGHWAVNCPHPKKESKGTPVVFNPPLQRTILGNRAGPSSQLPSRNITRSGSSLSQRGEEPTKLSNWKKLKVKVNAMGTFKNPPKVDDPEEHRRQVQMNAMRSRRMSKLDTAPARRDARRFTLLKADAQRQLNDEMGQAYLTEILQKIPEDRTEEDIAFLRQITKSLKFFDKMATQLHSDLCKVMKFEEVRAGEVVFYQGSIGKTFYVILSGSVTVHVKSTDGEEKPDENDKEEDEEKADKPQVIGRHVATIYGGESFGELALLKSTAMPRAASILAIEDAQFLTIHKTDYDKTLKKIQVQELENKIQFLRRFAFFKKWEAKRLTRFSHFMKKFVYNSSETIILEQGKTSDNVYLIYRGQCRAVYAADVGRVDEPLSGRAGGNSHAIQETFEMETSEQSDEDDLDDEDIPTEQEIREFEELEKYEELSMDICKPRLRVSQLRRTKCFMVPQRRKMRLELAILGPGEMFGEGGVLMNSPQLSMIIADNNTELLVINKTDFLKRMDDKSKSIAENLWKIKAEWLQGRLDHIKAMNPHGRPSQSFLIPGQMMAPRVAPSSVRMHTKVAPLPDEVVELLKHRSKRPHPPSQDRVEALAAPRNKMPSARNRKQLLEELEAKIREQDHIVWLQRNAQTQVRSARQGDTSARSPRGTGATMSKPRAQYGDVSFPSVASFDNPLPLKGSKAAQDKFHLPPIRLEALVDKVTLDSAPKTY